MKDILKDAQELRRFYDYYRAQLNGSRNPVLVPSGDVSLIQRLLDQLHQKTLFISPTMSAELADIRQYLFVVQGPGICSFNFSKFGALGVVLRYLQSEEFTCDIARYIRTPWQDINDAIKKLLIDANSVNTRIDYNQVGVAARELFIMLAQKVYSPEVKKVAAGRNISSSDAKGMLEAFFDYKSTDGTSTMVEEDDLLNDKTDVNTLYRLEKYKFEIYSNTYKFRVFTVENRTVFPIYINIDEGICAELNCQQREEVSSNRELEELVSSVFHSNKLKTILSRMLADKDNKKSENASIVE